MAGRLRLAAEKSVEANIGMEVRESKKTGHLHRFAHICFWLAQQMREAFPWSDPPKILLRDNDGAYGRVFRQRIWAMGIRDHPVAPHSPWMNGHVERVIGSIKRECLNHIDIVNEEHLRDVLREYADYYNNDRTHLALDKDTPRGRAIEREGRIISRPVLGGLHHRYSRKSSK